MRALDFGRMARWVWGNFDKVALLLGWAASFALPAWAIKVTGILGQYEPFSWVVAGFCGALVAVVGYAVAAWAHGKFIRARYDTKMLAQGGIVDALEKTFERRRIYLNEFCLPSHPYIENKAFIDCEIIGPANVIFVSGNSISNAKYPVVDAVHMRGGVLPSNGYIFKDCIFRGCNFSRVTFIVQHGETMFDNFVLVNWLTDPPSGEPQLQLEAQTESAEPPSQLPRDNQPEQPSKFSGETCDKAREAT